MLHTMDRNDCSILSEFEHVHDVLSDLQKKTASHYLNTYLSPFTDSYQALSTELQHLSARKHGALMAIERGDSVDPLIHSVLLCWQTYQVHCWNRYFSLVLLYTTELS